MIDAYNWILDNSDNIFMILTSIIATASVIAALTPTPKDDSFLAKTRAVVDFLAINVKNAKSKR
jgi:hypothetical protein